MNLDYIKNINNKNNIIFFICIQENISKYVLYSKNVLLKITLHLTQNIHWLGTIVVNSTLRDIILPQNTIILCLNKRS